MNSGPVADWYIESPSQTGQTGPFTAEQIQAQLGRGEITLAHKVTAEWLCGEWITVADLIAGYQAAQSTHGSASTAPSAPTASEKIDPVRMEVLQAAIQATPPPPPVPVELPSAPLFQVNEPLAAPPTAIDHAAAAPVRSGPFTPPPRPPEFLDVASTAEAVRPTHDPNLELFDTFQAAREKKGGGTRPSAPGTFPTETAPDTAQQAFKITPRMWKQLGAVLGGVLLVWAVITFVSRPASQPQQAKETAPEAAHEVRGGSATAPGFRSGNDFSLAPQHGGATQQGAAPQAHTPPAGNPSASRRAPAPAPAFEQNQETPPPAQDYQPQEGYDNAPPPPIEAPPPPPPNEGPEGPNIGAPPQSEANP